MENQESEEEVGMEENEDAQRNKEENEDAERNEEENEDAERNEEENEDAERKGENEDIKDSEYQVEIVDDEVETELHVREENLKTKLCKALWKALGQTLIHYDMKSNTVMNAFHMEMWPSTGSL